MSLELVLVAPAVLLLITLVVVATRLAVAQGAVEQAAASAARAASLARSASTADTHARTAAAGTLTDRRVPCAQVQVRVDTSGFHVPVGEPAIVRSTVRCAVPLTGLGLPLPGARTVTAQAASVLDTYRARTEGSSR